MGTTTALALASSNHSNHNTWPFFVVAALMIVVGLVNLTNPQLGWRMRRWQFANKEAWQPSAAALTFTRVAGGVAIVLGIVIMSIAAAHS